MIRRYAVDAVVAIGLLTLATVAVGTTARAGSAGCIAYVCQDNADCSTNCQCIVVTKSNFGSCGSGS